MNKVFFGTLLAHAKSELRNITPLLTRASNQFLPEKSIDHAIEHLERTKQLLLDAKQSYEKQYSQSEPRVLK